MKFNALIPEFAVNDLAKSLQYYCDTLGFDLVYERPKRALHESRLAMRK